MDAVDMGKPILKPELVPTTLAATKDGVAIDSPFKLKVSSSSQEYTYKATCVSMGNPHAVMFFDSLETLDPPFHVVGPIIEKHPVFPQRVNAEFIQVLSRSHLLMKVWERGAGSTLACDTGACAAVVAGVLSGRCDRTCKVTLPGGDLFIKWDEKDDKIYMTGPADDAVYDKLSQLDSDANNLPGVNCHFLDNFEMKMHTTDMTFSELYHEVSDIVANRNKVSHLPVKSKKRSYDNILPEAVYFFNNKLNYDVMSHSKAIEKGCETSSNPYEQSNDMSYNTSSSSNVYDLQSKQDKILECVVLESHLSTEANMYDFYKECIKRKN